MAQDIENAQHTLEATAPEGSPEAGFAKINGSKKVRGATPKPAEPVEPDPEKFAAIGGKFVGTTPERAEEIRNAPMATATPATPVSTIPAGSPFHDAAAKVLNEHGQALDIGTKADLWDVFNEAGDHNELATKLAPMNVPDAIKHELFMAKAALAPVQTHADRVIGVINHIGKLASTPEGKQMLEVGESHPLTLKLLTSDKG